MRHSWGENRQECFRPADIDDRRTVDPVQNFRQRILRLFFQPFEQIVDNDEFRLQQQGIGNPDAGLLV